MFGGGTYREEGNGALLNGGSLGRVLRALLVAHFTLTHLLEVESTRGLVSLKSDSLTLNPPYGNLANPLSSSKSQVDEIRDSVCLSPVLIRECREVFHVGICPQSQVLFRLYSFQKKTVRHLPLTCLILDQWLADWLLGQNQPATCSHELRVNVTF